jgi:hypothetical protein
LVAAASASRTQTLEVNFSIASKLVFMARNLTSSVDLEDDF